MLLLLTVSLSSTALVIAIMIHAFASFIIGGIDL